MLSISRRFQLTLPLNGFEQAVAAAKQQCGVSYTLSLEDVNPLVAAKVATGKPPNSLLHKKYDVFERK